MNYEPEGRILLAEFVGWRYEYDDGTEYPHVWRRPDNVVDQWRVKCHDDLPDPLNNHADCHALIEALRTKCNLTIGLFFMRETVRVVNSPASKSQLAR